MTLFCFYGNVYYGLFLVDFVGVFLEVKQSHFCEVATDLRFIYPVGKWLR